MEAIGGWFSCVVIFSLLFLFFLSLTDKGLQIKNKKIKKELQERTESVNFLIEKLKDFGVRFIDLDANPKEIEDRKVYKNIKGGLKEWNPEMFYIHISLTDEAVKGCDLYEELKNLKIANDNLLDFFLENQELIPDDFPEEVFFWGTIRICPEGHFYVRALKRAHHGVYGFCIKRVNSLFKAGTASIIMK